MADKSKNSQTKEPAYIRGLYCHPVLRENQYLRQKYFNTLISFYRIMCTPSEYSKNALAQYEKILNLNGEAHSNCELAKKFKLFIFLDLLVISKYDTKMFHPEMKMFGFDNTLSAIAEQLLANVDSKNPAWNNLINYKSFNHYSEWITAVRKNIPTISIVADKSKNSHTKEPAYINVLSCHPVLRENQYLRQKYFNTLVSFHKTMCTPSEYSKKALAHYKKSLNLNGETRLTCELTEKLKAFIVLDLLVISKYDTRMFHPEMKMFGFDNTLSAIVKQLLSNVDSKNPAWNKFINYKSFNHYSEWITAVRKNIPFIPTIDPEPCKKSDTKKKKREPVQRKIAFSQVLNSHPVLEENSYTQQNYFNTLSSLFEHMCSPSEYSQAVLKYYQKKLNPHFRKSTNITLSSRLKALLVMDLIVISGYDARKINKSILNSLHIDKSLSIPLENLLDSLNNDNRVWEKLINHSSLKQNANWIARIWKNISFISEKPFRILITATMSSGKSTFINSLVGRKIADTKNLACTGRLHYIYSKPFDDNILTVWDKELILDAGNAVHNQDEEIHSDISYESSFFSGRLKGKRCILLDTPGVNSAEYHGHGECTNEIIESGEYNAVVFLINYEHIGTDDEKNHLSFVREHIPADVPVMFVINKADSRKNDDLSLAETYLDVKNYLENSGYKKPAVFLASCRAAYLDRMNSSAISLNEDEQDELEVLTRKFRRRMNMINVYNSVKPRYIDIPIEETFEYQCGIGFIEDYILKLINKK